MKKEITIIEKEYFKDLQEIKEIIKRNQNKAMVVVNSAMIISYYETGVVINQRKQWGNKYVERLANDLKNYKGCSYRNLKYMSQFANTFLLEEIGQRPVAQISWRSIISIMSKCKDHNKALWYVEETYKNGWGKDILDNQIAMKAYERSLINPITTEVIGKSDDVINEIFKDTYVFDFLDKENIKTEKDLKNKMIDNIIFFLNELGPGFSLVGKEYKLITPTHKEFYIDLLMYHTKIHAYIVFEVKIGEFNPADFGQVVFYVNAMDRLEKTEVDNPTIGLLLCKETDKFVAETTISNSSSYVGISKYKFIEDLPEYLEKRLKEIKD